MFWFWARGCPPHAVCRGGRLLVPGAQQSHVCGRRRARTVDTRSKLWKAALTCLRECGSVQGAGTLRERASGTLGRDPVRPQLAYKSTSNLVNFPQSGRSGALSAVWQFSKLFRKPRPGTPTTRHGTRRVARFQLDLQETQRRRDLRRSAEACPGYCKPEGASQRTYSASTKDPWT